MYHDNTMCTGVSLFMPKIEQDNVISNLEDYIADQGASFSCVSRLNSPGKYEYIAFIKSYPVKISKIYKDLDVFVLGIYFRILVQNNNSIKFKQDLIVVLPQTGEYKFVIGKKWKNKFATYLKAYSNLILLAGEFKKHFGTYGQYGFCRGKGLHYNHH
jgi:hypothetical protein